MRCSWAPRRLLVVSLFLVVATLIGALPRIAAAQTIAISQMGINRKVPLRTDPTARFKVSRADCLANDVIEFPALVTNYGGTTLEVWATQGSTSCAEDTARSSASATCWRIYSAVPSDATTTVRVRVQDFAARPPSIEGQNAGTEASCNSTVSTAQPVTLWFMFLSGTAAVGMSAQWSTTVDLLGPAPPSVEQMDAKNGTGAGNELIKVSWAANTDPDVISYRIFCEDLGASGIVIIHDAASPPPDQSLMFQGPSFQTDSGCVDGGSDDASADDAGCPPDPGTGGTGGSGGSGNTDSGSGGNTDSGSGGNTDAGTGGSTGTTDGGGTTTDGGGTTAGCGTVLVQGKVLSLDEMNKYACGTVTGVRSTRGSVTGLTNFTKYAVAVAAADLVENIGTLSIVQCATPQPVNGFDEAYRNAGGTAGGASFCSIGGLSGAARARLGSGVGFLVGLALLVDRRRRGAARFKA